jgi:hypothetical protein
VRIIDGDELDTRVHHGRDEREISGQPVKFCNDQLHLVTPAGGKRLRQLGPIIPPAGLDLGEFGNYLAAGYKGSDRLLLGFEAKAAPALPISGNAVVGDE